MCENNLDANKNEDQSPYPEIKEHSYILTAEYF